MYNSSIICLFSVFFMLPFGSYTVVRTAKPGNLKDPSWVKNGVGRRVSHSFGYGLMDAAAMVRLARTWKTVPEQQRCEINAPHLDK